MMLDQAIIEACSAVGVIPPRGRVAMRKWIQADTTGKNGKGDGRLICDEDRVTCVNWQTGEKSTVWLKSEFTPADKKKFAERRAKDRREERKRADRAAAIAEKLLTASRPMHHPYLASKGFPKEALPVIDRDSVKGVGGEYLAPPAGDAALIVPARVGRKLTSAQLIWPDGTKKFLYGGEMSCAVHRIATGGATWLCEGLATGLSIRAALKGLNRRDTVLVCFSASNIAKVAKTIPGRCFIAADNDKPLDQFGGIGTGEHFARSAEKPFAMPPVIGTDFNDLHMNDGVFAVQRVLSATIREARM